MNLVVGSGPAGVAASAALLGRGLRVTMLDAGIELEAAVRKGLEEARGRPYERWDPAFIARIREGVGADLSGIPEKRAFGSRFHVQDVERFTLHPTREMEAVSSLAQGGLSNVWGAAILPYSEADLAGWPLRLAELAPHYESVMALFDACGAPDDLAAAYPPFTGKLHGLRLSRQSQAFLDDLRARRGPLAGAGLRFGLSRLALRLKGRDCVYCGLCLYGCPYDLIYSARHTLEDLRRSPGFDYRGGLVVDRVLETADGVRVEARERDSGAPASFLADKVFLACGVLSSTRIVLGSLGAHGRELRLKTNQHFVLPLLRFSSVPGVGEERLHTLAQVFLELAFPGGGEEKVHLQAYSYNDLYPRAVEGLLGGVYPRLAPAVERWLLGRLLILQGYLHSAYSPEVCVRLDAGTGRLRVRVEPNRKTRGKIRAAGRRLLRNAGRLRALPLLPLLRVSAAGGGAHLGGTFPMRERPGPFESDLLGRPHGLSRTHVVDAAVFPTVPANTITLSIMANAHRIASAA